MSRQYIEEAWNLLKEGYPGDSKEYIQKITDNEGKIIGLKVSKKDWKDITINASAAGCDLKDADVWNNLCLEEVVAKADLPEEYDLCDWYDDIDREGNLVITFEFPEEKESVTEDVDRDLRKWINYDRSDYQHMGYKNRMDFLMTLAKEYDIPLRIVKEEADKLGKGNDLLDLEDILKDLQDYSKLSPIEEALDMQHIYEVTDTAFNAIQKALAEHPGSNLKLHFIDKFPRPAFITIEQGADVDTTDPNFIMIVDKDTTLEEINNKLKELDPGANPTLNVGYDLLDQKGLSKTSFDQKEYRAIANNLGEGGKVLLLTDGTYISAKVLAENEPANFTTGDTYNGYYVIDLITKENKELSATFEDIITDMKAIQQLLADIKSAKELADFKAREEADRIKREQKAAEEKAIAEAKLQVKEAKQLKTAVTDPELIKKYLPKAKEAQAKMKALRKGPYRIVDAATWEKLYNAAVRDPDGVDREDREHRAVIATAVDSDWTTDVCENARAAAEQIKALYSDDLFTDRQVNTCSTEVYKSCSFPEEQPVYHDFYWAYATPEQIKVVWEQALKRDSEKH